MAPRRSVRSKSPYKRGDYVEYQYKGSTATGKLVKVSPNGTDARPIWVVAPSDRRRNNEEIYERALGKVITAQEASNSRGIAPGNYRKSSSSKSSAPSSSSDDDKGGRRSPTAAKKRKSDDDSNNNSDRAEKARKNVASDSAPTSKANANKAKNGGVSSRYGTRSTRGSGEAILLPDLPVRKKKLFKQKTVKKDENVTVVKMLTGTLYLYRGERPRAEFVRTR
ncbi:hypothetical protein ACHAXT_005007 [Thalassiosira profunda]